MKVEKEVSIEPFFLGPKSENEYSISEKIQITLNHWFQGRKSLFEEDPPAINKLMRESSEFKLKQQKISESLEQLNNLLRTETPTYTPRYIGHMVSEISLPAILGHFSALLYNPNNTSADVARVGSQIEREAIAMLLDLVGYNSNTGCGHFTSGGTVANFEAIWRARFRLDHWLSLALYLADKKNIALDIFAMCALGWDKFYELLSEHEVELEALRSYSLAAGNPWRVANIIARNISRPFLGPVLLIPGNKHFSWQKGCNIFGFGEEALWSIPLDKNGRLDIPALEALILRAHDEARPIVMIVSVAGTTETGVLDPVDKVQDLLDKFKAERGWNFWHHVDAAYGGFMCSLNHHEGIASSVLNPSQKSALLGLARANSITMDPHKMGYIPYSCGAFLVPDEKNYVVSQFKAPYLQRQDIKNSKWSSTIEGSRAASGAAATWLTGKSLGFSSSDFAGLIASTFQACRDFQNELCQAHSWARVLQPSDTNILCFSVAKKGQSLSIANDQTSQLFDRIALSPNFSVSKTVMSKAEYGAAISEHVRLYSGDMDSDHLVLIRCVFMNPFWQSSALGSKVRAEMVKEIGELFELPSSL